MTPHPASAFTQADWVLKLQSLLALEMRVDASSIDPGAAFTECGLDSIAALTIAGQLEDLSGLELPPTLLWDFPTIDALAGYMVQQTVALAA